jgi:hypothetical protein
MKVDKRGTPVLNRFILRIIIVCSTFCCIMIYCVDIPPLLLLLYAKKVGSIRKI